MNQKIHERKNIVAITGSASDHSVNEKIIDLIVEFTETIFDFTVFKELKTLPHFDPRLAVNDPPEAIRAFRKMIEDADGVIICTPEYVFSIPSGLKNAIEWCVATTVFSDKPTGLITAAANGERAHEELRLIMKTLTADLSEQTCLLIQGAKGKMDENGSIQDERTRQELNKFAEAFNATLTSSKIKIGDE